MRDGPEYTPAFPEDVLSRIEDRTDWEMMLCPTREYTRPDFQIIMMIWPLQHSGTSQPELGMWRTFAVLVRAEDNFICLTSEAGDFICLINKYPCQSDQ